ncbi:MAG: succinate dehydrogenase/fumarate reductase iron-sulfur subunit, partial [candidate division WOR-3 bacterium]
GMTVLAALFSVQDRFDDSLSFRYSCRGAVCGSCAMLINKVPRLACRTQVKAVLEAEQMELRPFAGSAEGVTWEQGEEVLVEPLPNLPKLKDLVVDMSRFFEYFQKVEPVLKPGEEPPEHEYAMQPQAVTELEPYTNCILCASCLAACPVSGRNQAFLGPAALAKLYRFAIDLRESGDGSRLLQANTAQGWWACEFHTNCRAVCPRGVPPNIAIGKARAELQKSGRKAPEV